MSIKLKNRYSFRLWRVLATLLLGLLPCAGTALAGTLFVPIEFATVQEAIGAAVDGDEVVVLPGVYEEVLSFLGKNIVVRSDDPTSTPVVAATVVRGAIFAGTETADCVLTGFTISGRVNKKTGYGYGGGISGQGTRATIEYNIVEYNIADYGGGMAQCHGLIFRNTIRNNLALMGGGGLYMCGGIIRENLVEQNRAHQRISSRRGRECPYYEIDHRGQIKYYGCGGGGLKQCGGLIEYNTITKNAGISMHWYHQDHRHPLGPVVQSSYMSGGGMLNCYGIIRNNWIVENESHSGGGICKGSGKLYNNIIVRNHSSGLSRYEGIASHNVIVENRAGRGGGVDTLSGTFRNNIVWGNTAQEHPQMAPSQSPAYNCIQDWPSSMGVGNIPTDPRFVNAALGDYRLRPDSPCIDAGGEDLVARTDFDGIPRPLRGAPGWTRGDGSGGDIGAFEHPGPPMPGLIIDVVLNRTAPHEIHDLNDDDAIDIADLRLTLVTEPFPTPLPTSSPTPAPSPSPTPTPVPTPGETLVLMLPGDIPLELVRIPAGEFTMGTPLGVWSRDTDEYPLTRVTLTRDFHMGKYEVTQAQWLALMGGWPGDPPTPEYGEGPDYPAYWVSWHDAWNFIESLNAHLEATDQGPATMRLPTEAEWEYACRAGTTTRFSFGDSHASSEDPDRWDLYGPAGDWCEDNGERSQSMWYCGNKESTPLQRVGLKLPNAFGLFDMHGNIMNWCQDWYTNSLPGWSVIDPTGPTMGVMWGRVVRGGHNSSYARDCRSAKRFQMPPTSRWSFTGFRVVSIR